MPRYNTLHRASLIALVIFFISAVISIATTEINRADLDLYVVKCGKCHSQKAIIRYAKGYKGESEQNIAKVVVRMEKMKNSGMTPADSRQITRFLATADLDRVAQEIENSTPSNIGDKPAGKPEEKEITDIIEHVHAGAMTATFLALGIYMPLSGLRRRSERVKPLHMRKFNWKRHVNLGKVYITIVLAGYLSGFYILIADNFQPGRALPHLIIGTGIVIFFAISGYTGTRLAKGKKKFRNLHLISTLIATLLFIANIISGIMLGISSMK